MHKIVKKEGMYMGTCNPVPDTRAEGLVEEESFDGAASLENKPFEFV